MPPVRVRMPSGRMFTTSEFDAERHVKRSRAVILTDAPKAEPEPAVEAKAPAPTKKGKKNVGGSKS